jgi:UDP-galactopyranose mutase
MSDRHDVIVVGAGISGLTFAWHAARAGRQVLVVDGAARPGGCLHTERQGDFWFELGAHTCYNSYIATIEVLEGAGLGGELQRRGKPVLRFLDGDRVAPGKNLALLLRRMSWWELARSLPRALGARPEGQSVRSYYGRMVGERNYARALGPMLSAVPSQPADDLPADMLFKKRTERRRDLLKSFTLRRGLGALPEALARAPGITFAGGRRAARIEKRGAGWDVVLADDTVAAAAIVCVAAGPRASGALLERAVPDVAATMARLGEAAVDSTGVVVRADRSPLPYATFFIPIDDRFYSVVTRDVVPDPGWRAFVFHFKPGLGEAARLERIAAVLQVPRADFAHVASRRSVLPAPVLGHREAVARVDAALAGTTLAVSGNWFGGLGIEDCALRSRAEWRRVGA